MTDYQELESLFVEYVSETQGINDNGFSPSLGDIADVKKYIISEYTGDEEIRTVHVLKVIDTLRKGGVLFWDDETELDGEEIDKVLARRIGLLKKP